MRLLTCILTEIACYKANRTITPKGVMVHSTGANNPNIKRYVQPVDSTPDRDELLRLLGVNANANDWTHAARDACVHAFIGKLADGSIAACQTLPWNWRGWHAGPGSKGSANNTHISFEICEDDLTDQAYFDKVYREAVELTAMLCKQYALDPLADGVVICHQEGYQRGVACNHSDVFNWFPKRGKSMDDFRADVAAEMGGTVEPVEVNYQARVTASAGLNCRTAPVNGDIIETFPFDTVWTVTKERSGWGFTGEGWVSLEYVEKLTPADTPDEPDTPAQKEDGMTCYKTLDDVPEYYRPTVEKLVEAGALTGDGDGLNVTEDFCRIMTVLDRLGKLD